MDKIIINGGKPLYGTIPISGAKNAALPLLAATLLVPGWHTIHNFPNLRDTRTTLKLLETLGVKWERLAENSVRLNSRHLENIEASYDLVKTMRASVLVLGPLLARQGMARVSLPGGCAIGARPIDFHLQGFEKMGAILELKDGYVDAHVENRLHGALIYFDVPSVTGTENIIMAAVLAEGTTVVNNAAREPEVGNLIDMLNGMGARITGKDSDKLTVHGVENLHAVETTVIPDRIETGTYMMAVGAAGGDVILENCTPNHLTSLLEKLAAVGLEIEENSTSIRVRRVGALQNVDIKTQPYPGFPTDLQAQIMALMTFTNGLSVVNETIFENRFMHVAELCRMGADIKVNDRTAIVTGNGHLAGARVMATDLRASASLVIAALAAEGRTEISRIYHLERGYDNLVGKLVALGADIRQVVEQ